MLCRGCYVLPCLNHCVKLAPLFASPADKNTAHIWSSSAQFFGVKLRTWYTKMHTGWQELDGWFHDTAREKSALINVAYVNLCVNNNKKWANILRWLVGVNLGSFCAFVGGRSKRNKKYPWCNFRLVMLMETVQVQQMRSVPTEVVCVWMIVYINGCIYAIYICPWVSTVCVRNAF